MSFVKLLDCKSDIFQSETINSLSLLAIKKDNEHTLGT